MILSEHERQVASHYDDFTESFYLNQWDEEDIHFGLFTPECDSSLESFKQSLKRMTRAVVEPANICDHQVVVDAGCGVGGPALDVVRWFGCQVTGISISHKQLAMATARAEAAGLQHKTQFEYADCSTHLPFADNSVDVVFAIQSACHFSNRQQFLHECFRILKPGGSLALSDWMATDGISPEDYDAYIVPACESWVLAALETRSSYLEKLNSAGFVVQTFDDFGTAVLENGRVLNTLYLKILLHEAAGIPIPANTHRWKDQFKTLSQAWLKGHFTIENCHAQKPLA